MKEFFIHIISNMIAAILILAYLSIPVLCILSLLKYLAN